jgi:hypothetical protein
MKKYKNYIGVAILGIILFGCGFFAGRLEERASSLDKLSFVSQYAILLEEENSMLYECCRK